RHRLETVDRAERLRPSRPEQTRDTEDLASPQLELDVIGKRRRRKLPDTQDRLAGLVRHARKKLGERTSHHELDDVARDDVRDLSRPRRASVAQNREAIGDAEDLVEEVADVDHAHAFIAKAPDDLEEAFGVVMSEGARRLVEDEDPRLARDRARDLDDLLLAHAERRHRSSRIDLAVAENRERIAHPRVVAPSADEPEAR